jgi:VanZ family protein
MSGDKRFKYPALICRLMWVGLLVAGLWPFNFFPRNGVKWLGDTNGVRFSRYGQIYGKDFWKLNPQAATPDGKLSWSLELWLEPASDVGWGGTIVTDYDPAQRPSFAIDQSLSDLVVRAFVHDQAGQLSFKNLWLDDIFRLRRNHFVTITADPKRSTSYVEGVRLKSYPYAIDLRNFSGTLLLGHSASGDGGWSGTLRGLALYDRTLTPQQVLEHCRAWQEADFRHMSTAQPASAIYAFDEKGGNLVHDRAGRMSNLTIPRNFAILNRTFLSGPDIHHIEWMDIALNIFGFIPFGFVTAAYVLQARPMSSASAALVATIIGAATSLMIELLQAYLPSRDSSLLDFINNALGAGLGALMINIPAIFDFFAFIPRSGA